MTPNDLLSCSPYHLLQNKPNIGYVRRKTWLFNFWPSWTSHDRKLRNQFMIEQNRECQYYFSDLFSQENYFVWVREVFHKSRIPTKLNLVIMIIIYFRIYLSVSQSYHISPSVRNIAYWWSTLKATVIHPDFYFSFSCKLRSHVRCVSIVIFEK